ncbi:hypothetical protein [Streptomyces sp. NBC_01304]|uniref:hypothetical protein n=1 Tax=Streptomyces sp. NBC_01304 TaxID=2903818 RepID=UPI002E11B8AC|nr:hypothetical protein OG430_42190 [Streptomyces sp. NBC_01304]
MDGSRTVATLGSAAAAAILITLSAAGQALAVDKPTEPGELKLIDTPAGKALADKDGNPLYLRAEDKADTPDCTGDCATNWPAAIGYPTKAEGVDGDTGQTKDNPEGADKPQVIYNTHPLYYFKDDQPNEPKGQDVKGWNLVGADGSALKADAAPDESASPSASANASAKPSDGASDGASKSPEPGKSTEGGTSSSGASTPKPNETPAASEAGAGSGESPSALKATPKGAASGGAVHAADTASSGPSDLPLAFAAAAIVGAGSAIALHRRRSASKERQDSAR